MAENGCTEDERARLVKTFAYEYVSFNHDPNRIYLVTDVTDDCTLELEGSVWSICSTFVSAGWRNRKEALTWLRTTRRRK